MVRTQIYLTEKQKEELAAIAGITGKKQSEIIREAIDRFISETGTMRRENILEKTAGIWSKRDDLPDFREVRDEWDRDDS